MKMSIKTQIPVVKREFHLATILFLCHTKIAMTEKERDGNLSKLEASLGSPK
jgi:hypothetical protein